MEKLVQLADLDNTGDTAAIDATLLAAQIQAEGWIHSYAQKRYAVPFNPVTDIIKQLAAQEAIYRLTQRRNMTTTEERQDHAEREQWLENLARGLVSPGVDPEPSGSANVVPAVLPRTEDENISRLSLERW